MTDGVFRAPAMPNAITDCFEVVDSLLHYYMESNGIMDKNHAAVCKQLNARREDSKSAALYE